MPRALWCWPSDDAGQNDAGQNDAGQNDAGQNDAGQNHVHLSCVPDNTKTGWRKNIKSESDRKEESTSTEFPEGGNTTSTKGPPASQQEVQIFFSKPPGPTDISVRILSPSSKNKHACVD